MGDEEMVNQKDQEEGGPFPARSGTLPTTAIRPSEPNYRQLVESAGDMIYALDLEGRFTFYNSKASEVLGYGLEEFLGRRLTEILTPESAKVALNHFLEGIQGQETSPFFEAEALRKDGTTVHLEVRASSFYRNGRLAGRQGIARDISELKRLQAEVAQKAERIALLEDRNRIARELYDSIAQIVFKTAADPETTDALLSEVRSSLRAEVARTLELSEVDLTIIELISQGLSNKGIGQQVCLSPDTVKDRVRKIMDRLGVRRRTELVAEAARRGLI